MIDGMLDHHSVRQQAERNAPYPKVEPSHAGLTGFFFACCAMAIFLAIFGLKMDGNIRVALAVYAIMAAAFAIPYFYFNNQRRRHHREWLRLYNLAKERDA